VQYASEDGNDVMMEILDFPEWHPAPKALARDSASFRLTQYQAGRGKRPIKIQELSAGIFTAWKPAADASSSSVDATRVATPLVVEELTSQFALTDEEAECERLSTQSGKVQVLTPCVPSTPKPEQSEPPHMRRFLLRDSKAGSW
jgi:hypothetical protein